MEEQEFIAFEQEEFAEEERPQKKYKQSRPSMFLTDSPWLRCPYSTDLTFRLHEEILDFCSHIKPTFEEHRAREILIEKIAKIAKTLWPEAILKVFGSFETKLYLPTSDIDLMVVCERATLKKLAKALSRSSIAEKGTLKVISKARIPIIKFVDKATNFDVDISLNYENGVETVPVVLSLLRKHPALGPLTLVIKQFLEQRQLNHVFAGGLGSHSVLVLVASFLELHPFIQSKWIKEEENLGVLLLDFLELYGKNFNYEDLGISLDSYFDKRDVEFDQPQRYSLLCIKDPQNPLNDLGKNSFSMYSVKQAFEHAFHLLVVTIGDCEMDDEISLLSSLIQIPEKTLHHRYYIEQTTNV